MLFRSKHKVSHGDSTNRKSGAIVANGNGTYVMQFTVTSARPYVSIRLGVSGTTNGPVTFYNIGVQRKSIFTDGAYNTNVDLGWLSTVKSTDANGVAAVDSNGNTRRWEKLASHDQYLTYGEPYSSLNVPTREGYTFLGWFDANGTQYTDASGNMVGNHICTTDGLKLYSRWTANSFILRYNGNKPSNATSDVASVPADQTLKYGVADKINSTPPTLKGWTFKGWYKTQVSPNPTATAPYKAGSTISAADTVSMFRNATNGVYTIYAGWEANKITVKFDGNYATSGSMNPQTFVYDTAQNLNANQFGRSYTVTYNGNGGTSEKASESKSFDFAGWRDATGSYNYADKASVKNPNGVTSGETTLYAKWTNGSITLPGATRAGYDFNGWYTAATGGTLVGTKGSSYTAADGVKSVQLYAHWTARTDTVYKVNVYIMDTKGAYPSSARVFSYKGTTDTTATIKADTYFPDTSGQFSRDDSKTNKLSGNIAGDGSLVLTVYIKRASHTVTYNYTKNGGTSVSISPNTKTVYYQGDVDLTVTAAKSGWTFVGWNTDSTKTTKLTSLKMSKSNIELFAIFTCTPKATFYYFDGTTQKSVTVSGAAVYNTANTITFAIPTISAKCTVNSLSWTAKGFTTATSYSGSGTTASGNMTFTGTLSNNSVVKYYMCYFAPITITHNGNGGTLNGSNPSATSYLNASSASNNNSNNSNNIDINSDSQEDIDEQENSSSLNRKRIKKVGKRTKKGSKGNNRKLKYQSNFP